MYSFSFTCKSHTTVRRVHRLARRGGGGGGGCALIYSYTHRLKSILGGSNCEFQCIFFFGGGGGSAKIFFLGYEYFVHIFGANTKLN